MKENAREILQKNTSDLIPYERNPRVNDKAVDYLANSIQEFGFQNPIIIDDHNVIICGHTRLKAAIKLGIKTVPCLVASNLTKSQIKAFRIADNKISEISEWDDSLLASELLGLSDIDMTKFGMEPMESFKEPASLKKIPINSPPRRVIIVAGFDVSRIKDAQKVIDFAESLSPEFLDNTFTYEKTNED